MVLPSLYLIFCHQLTWLGALKSVLQSYALKKKTPPLIIIIIVIMLISAGAGECDELDIIIKVLRPRMSLWHFATPPAPSTAANA